MSLAVDLMGVGLPQEQAVRLGYSALTSITTAGTTQGTATAIPALVNNALLVTAGGATGARLPSDAELMVPYLVVNSTSTTGVVYPPTSGTINSGSANAGVNIAQNEAKVFIRESTNRWISFSTESPSILGTANTWTALQTFTNQVIFRGAVPTVLKYQPAATAKTTSATLTAAEVLAGIITVNQGAGATSAQQLPTGTDLEAALPATLANNDSFDFSVINISVVDAEDASVTTNAGWTLVGNMDIPAYSAAGSLNSSGLFRARRTAANTFTLYRIG